MFIKMREHSLLKLMAVSWYSCAVSAVARCAAGQRGYEYHRCRKGVYLPAEPLLPRGERDAPQRFAG